MGWTKIPDQSFYACAERGVKAMARKGELTEAEARETLAHIAAQRAAGEPAGAWTTTPKGPRT